LARTSVDDIVPGVRTRERRDRRPRFRFDIAENGRRSVVEERTFVGQFTQLDSATTVRRATSPDAVPG
jgi:hypothetical protein